MWRLVVDRTSPSGRAASALLGYLGVPARLDERRSSSASPPRLATPDGPVVGLRPIVRCALAYDDVPSLGGEPRIDWCFESFFTRWVARAAREARGRKSSGFVRRLARLAGVDRARSANRDALGGTLRRVESELEHLYARRSGYLGGRRPALLDFLVFGALGADENGVGGERPALRQRLDWLAQMELPHPVVALREGPGVEPAALRPLAGEMFGTYWRVLCENLRALEGAERESASVTLVDGTEYEWVPSRLRVDLLERLFRALDAAAGASPEQLGGSGLGVVGALRRAVESLHETERGREFADEYPALCKLLE